MKPTTKRIALALCCTGMLTACNISNGSKTKTLPTPGTVVAIASMPIPGDNLNKREFSVTVSADSAIANGTYDITAVYGYDTAHGMMTMPRGLDDYKIVIQKGNGTTSWVIGFKQPDDTTFNDYLEVNGMRNTIDMHYLKSYTFE